VYELRPEYAGRLLECPVCGHRLRAGHAPGAPRPPAPDVDPAFDRDVFLLRERVFTIRTKYEVWAEDGTPVLYIERPTFPVRTLFAYVLGALAALVVLAWMVNAARAAGLLGPVVLLLAWIPVIFTFVVVSMSARPRRHVTVFRDDSRRDVLLRVLQDQRLAFFSRTYTVLLAKTGEPLARLRKTYPHSVVRKRWYVETPAGQPLGMAIEDSLVLSLLRRMLGVFFGFLRTNFLLVRGADEDVFGQFNRKFTLLDRYVLDLREDPERTFDRRIALALGVMLDTGERR